MSHKPLVPGMVNMRPIARAIRAQRGLMYGTLVAASSVAGGQAFAQETITIEEIVVSSQKRDQNMQDVPISIQALDSIRLEQLGIHGFDDYANMLPSLTYKSVGPGLATIYMRGASDGGDGNPSGSQPSVGLYLDEQPVTAIGQNLDVHIYDIARIEALAGPQGTLYGASSQSGTLRIITNKPDSSGFEGGFDVAGYSTAGGEPSQSFEGFLNIPLGDAAALRLVGWNIADGGYIDNIAGSRTYALEGGYGYNGNNFGRTRSIDNGTLVKNDANELNKRGARAALLVDLNDSWTGTLGVITQNMKTRGTWDHDPDNVGDLNIQRFYPDKMDDEFTQLSFTLEGDLGNHSLTYAGSLLNRDVDYTADYTAYGEDAYWVPYYACDYSAVSATDSATDCTSLEEFYREASTYKRTTHELRLQSNFDGPFNYTVGYYRNENEHKYLLEWVQPGMSPNRWARGKADIFFTTDQERTDSQSAIFGEGTYDLTDAWSLTLGARFFENESDVAGYVGWGQTLFGDNSITTDTDVDDDDQIYKGTLTWRANDDVMIYGSISEGYRPGGVNRDPGLVATTGQQSWDADYLTNYEIGFKSMLLDSRLRLNGALYRSDWDDIQYTVYEFALSACCGNVYNLSTAEITGFELDATYLVGSNLTLSAAMAYNDAETTDDFTLPNGTLSVPDGTALPNVPEYKGNVTARYEFELGSYGAFWQLSASYTGERFNEIRPSRRTNQDSYTLANFRAGINADNWSAVFFVNNLTDEVAEISVSQRPYEPSTTTNRPRSIGIRFSTSF